MKYRIQRFPALSLVLAAGLACTACERTDNLRTPAGSSSSSSSSSDSSRTAPKTTTPAPPATPPAADNTDRNKADRDTDSKTPMDQGQSATDIKITADIRRAIMSDKAMSVNAQNCKIITEKGMVTLRGVVSTQGEKDAIEGLAKGIAGAEQVTNLLEVKAN